MPLFKPGYRLDNAFKIIKKLGKGGTSEVYLAQARSKSPDIFPSLIPGQWVALKCLKPKYLKNKKVFAAMIWENEILTSINHDAVISTYGFRLTCLNVTE